MRCQQIHRLGVNSTTLIFNNVSLKVFATKKTLNQSNSNLFKCTCSIFKEKDTYDTKKKVPGETCLA